VFDRVSVRPAPSENPDSMTVHTPDAPENEEWDVVVVGTGMGGSTIGYALARRGLRVLFLEKGRFLQGARVGGDGRLGMDDDQSPEGLLDRGLWPHPIRGDTSSGTREFAAAVGCGSGGTTNVYAAQLERLAPSDFAPRKHFPNVETSTLPETWPIEYEELVPFYREAEKLFHVSGTHDALLTDAEATLRVPPPLSPRDEHLFQSFGELGLHPYRPHCGFEFVPGCDGCGGVLCPRECKSDAFRICLKPALEQHGAKILSDCEVTSFDADQAEVRAVHCLYRGRELRIFAKTFVLAAGALMSPVLLLRSVSERWPQGLANTSGQVGRNLMFHVSDFVAVRPTKALSADGGPIKALAFTDFYVHGGQKLGAVQSIGIPVGPGSVLHFLRNALQWLPRIVQKLLSPFLRVVAYVAGFYFRHAHVLAAILEDLPYPHNRVVLDPASKNGMRFEYEYPRDLHARRRAYANALRRVLGKRHRLMVLNREPILNIGHACGTCRFGDDARTSVLDANNRAHGLTNLYVVDASFFPSSGGTNPSLTIAANALRVANVIRPLEATAAERD
jgi:choline dehydrogenase-like flavoprotein